MCCIISSTSDSRSVLLCLVCEDLAPGKLLSSPKDAVADPLPKHGQWTCGVLLGNCYQVLEGVGGGLS